MARTKFLDEWLESEKPDGKCPNLIIFSEKANTRDLVVPAVCGAVMDHLVGLAVIKRIGGYKKAAHVIENRLPAGKKIRSGDLGEILATEYVDQKTDYQVPIKRLRYKDDRKMAMRGDDVIGIRIGKKKRVQVLKVESKSRASLATSVIEEASASLVKNSSRPNPSTLAFISVRLRELGRHAEAKLVEGLQQHDVKDADIEHLIFTFSGNDPGELLAPHAKTPRRAGILRHLVGLVVKDHQAFIKHVFETIK